MSMDLEARLQSLAEGLPDPSNDATTNARRAMHEALAAAPWATGRRRSWFSRGSRPYLLAAAVALVVAGAALAATRWSIRDLPPFGDADQAAFVLPATDVLPGGYERTRPPRYAELPSRPSLLFPAGVGYGQALSRYLAARSKGRVLPAGVVLDDPLPDGKAVLVRDDGRIVLDPAAPMGYSTTTGLVNVPYGSRLSEVPPIARCQLLRGTHDPDSHACDAPGASTSYVREGVGGRWLPSPIAGIVTDVLAPASTSMSVIDHPSTALERLPTKSVPRFPGFPRPLTDKARIALRTDRVSLVAVPTADHGLCLGAITRRIQGATWTCGPRASMLDRGVVFLSVRPGTGRLRISGFVGDGIDRVRAGDGTTAPVVNNAFTMVPADGVRRFTFSGPVGSFTVVQPGPARGPDQAPDRSRERELVGIALARGGGRASIRVAPTRGGGLCYWVYIKGDSRSNACPAASAKIPYDVVTGGLYPGGPGYPFVYAGRFAPEVGAVEMDFADGTSERLPLTEGFALYEVPPSRIASRATWPVSVTTFDRRGVALVRDPLRGFAAIVHQQQGHP